ncbi:MAG: aminotransferase class I/II-fold pyridoxal phosphate-dependent enzyme [Holophagaceae bacterium]|nr:aminotransferase class I/II-fold pyridoxal phosphate-dependent enzyme [Holophagaceae bacterium]
MEIRQALSLPSVLAYDPDAQGSRSAREAIAAHHGHGLRAEDLLLTASTSEGYGLLFKLLGDPGDEVLVPSPSYPLFEWLARLEGLTARPVPSYFPTAGTWTWAPWRPPSRRGPGPWWW